MDKVFDILVTCIVWEEGHVGSLNYLTEGQSLEALFKEDIENKPHTSFDIDVVSISRIFCKALETTSLIHFAHFAIDEANKTEQDKGKKNWVWQ